MLPKILSGLLIVTGIIHLLPLSGVLGAERLAALYGLSFEEPNLLLLMRSRALLFGLLGAFMIYAAWRPTLQPLALFGGLVSVLGFLLLAWSAPGYNDALRRVVIADWIALACLALAVLLYQVARGKA
ncbi:phosphopantetheine adenylyltransferase [Pseudomonas sp. CC6-YY-74]|uniref:phosphopantetheine adenylyltransferase n=1 Tax=Pseudomonas sp. CC6-YY-74 TaxID=1930532 RepID=UPI0021153A8B|nr:phosphopantetheine adenylyltransferase [Pseudomonas sp. CC6-YY-74]